MWSDRCAIPEVIDPVLYDLYHFGLFLPGPDVLQLFRVPLVFVALLDGIRRRMHEPFRYLSGAAAMFGIDTLLA